MKECINKYNQKYKIILFLCKILFYYCKIQLFTLYNKQSKY